MKFKEYLNESNNLKIIIKQTEKPSYSNNNYAKFEIYVNNNKIGKADVGDIKKGKGKGQITLDKKFAKEQDIDLRITLFNAKPNAKFIKDILLKELK